MAITSIHDAVKELAVVFKETFEGGDPDNVYYLDAGPKFGVFGTLEALDAATASKPSGGRSPLYGDEGSGPDTASVAAHANHIIQALHGSVLWLRDHLDEADWDASWAVQDVDEADWDELRKKLRAEYATMLEIITQEVAVNPRAMASAATAVAHSAYHLGRIHEKLDAMA